ncbi:MAG: aldo/keto reductase [Lachnospiraceae bacterium]|nr:aldo/keto reductase [Lachnospiraceae bacterium]
MEYNTFQNLNLSALGLGAMRLPTIDGNDAQIDEAASAKMLAYAMENGINYYDTAWGYHGGNSEIVMGKLLKEYPRDSFYLASKFPGYDLDNMNKVAEIFEKQLERCQVEYFDFYMFHNVCELNIEGYLDAKFGIFEYLMEQKKNGRIRHLGFSTHGTLETMTRFLDAYGAHMEFCQIQLNWLGWDFQDAKAKVELLNKYNIPIWVMEPVRGGSLVNLAEEYQNRLHSLKPKRSLAEWAFRFLQSIPGVTMTLSGMSNMEQLAENIKTYETKEPLTDAEMDTLLTIAREMTSKNTLPCTGCKYCTTHCPQGLNIPWFIELYNEHIYSGGGFIAPMAMSSLAEDKKPSACLGCKACEMVCPQKIKIADMMTDFAVKMN